MTRQQQLIAHAIREARQVAAIQRSDNVPWALDVVSRCIAEVLRRDDPRLDLQDWLTSCGADLLTATLHENCSQIEEPRKNRMAPTY